MASNNSLFPHRPPVDPDGGGTRVLDLETDETAELCSTLASETATGILSQLNAEPMVASELADAVDTSIQNVQHHLGRLQEVGLVEVVDTWYSSRGAEMNVYAPAHERLLIAAAGREGEDVRDEGRSERTGSDRLLAVTDGD